MLTALGPAEGAGLEQLFFDLTGPGAATPGERRLRRAAAVPRHDGGDPMSAVTAPAPAAGRRAPTPAPRRRAPASAA